MAKQLTVALIGENSHILLGMVSKQEAKNWATLNKRSSPTAFEDFKKALRNIGVDYGKLKKSPKTKTRE